MRPLVAVFAVAVALYLPTVQYGFVQDDRGIIAANPAAHSIGAALRAVARPYWPPPAEGGLYRPLTILSFAIDWAVAGGRPGWFHLMNALWHGLAVVLVVLVLARWLPEVGALTAGLVFALHPVHVEGVASLVSRAELLAAVGMLGAVVAARRRWWAGAVGLTAMAMVSKEHGVATGVLILLDDWLQGRDAKRYSVWLYAALGAVTVGFIAAWLSFGHQAAADVAPPFIGKGTLERLGLALPAVLRAARLLIWPLDLSADYNPQVIRVPEVLSAAAVGGALVVAAVPALAWWCRRRAPAVTLAAGVAALSYLPTSNLLFPSGVVLAERNLYLAVLLPAVVVGQGAAAAATRWGLRPAIYVVAVIALACGARSLSRLSAWKDNRSYLLTLLREHPESYRAHASAAAVLAGTGDTAGARREYVKADSLFAGDPHLDAARAFFLVGQGDTTTAATLARRARRVLPRERVALRTQFLVARIRGDGVGALLIADSAGHWYPHEQAWYRQYLQ
ncbi:MAG: hypothetical protein HYS40_07255 [Gemmatimonadetes bacterium]|nr:hypothetical protein [Gemmatimonadota bacterium]